MDNITRILRGLAITTLQLTGGLAISPKELASYSGPIAAKVGNGEPAHMPALPKASNGGMRAGGKVYKVKADYNRDFAKLLKGTNARAFAGVLDASKGGKKAPGISARDLATKAKINPKTVESNLYQLRTMQLVESHDAAV